jgi:NAD+ diphosphatase
MASSRALCFAVRRGHVLVVEAHTASIPCIADLDALDRPSHYLGALDGVDCFAVVLDTEADPPEGMALHPLRPLHAVLPDELFQIAGRAVQIAEWDETHRFCGRCGSPTEDSPGERAKRCAACGLHAYPRIAPAVIVRVTRGDEILLAHGLRFEIPVYSVLAGFVDPGESLEETVVREVKEEAGIELTDIRYFGSQSWPFPHSLMVGFTAEYAGGELQIEEDELADAQWFGRDNLPPLPMSFSIARKLIDDFVAKA